MNRILVRSVIAFFLVVATLSFSGCHEKIKASGPTASGKDYERQWDEGVVCDVDAFTKSTPEAIHKWKKEWQISSREDDILGHTTIWNLPNGVYLSISTHENDEYGKYKIDIYIDYKKSSLSGEEDTLEILRALGLKNWTHKQGAGRLGTEGKLSRFDRAPTYDVQIDKKTKMFHLFARFSDCPY